MNTGTVGISELFNLLESNKLVEVEETKKVFHDHFLCTRDNWLVNGLFDYYLSTNSLRAAEVLTGVREPHDKYLLDRLAEVLSKSGHQNQKIRALTLLSHVARRQPTWLYKLTNHSLFRDLLKLLKGETDMLSLMSSLFLLVMLLPMLPAALGPHLQEIFEVFSRLASFHYHRSISIAPSNSLMAASLSSNIDKDHLYLLHLQVGLYNLFHRLYAMYPCNFISYLKQQYMQKDHLSIFTRTIRPMLDSVRMHPLLVHSSKDEEISAARWKKMEHHDVVAECGRFTVNNYHENTLGIFNSRFMPLFDRSSTTSPLINIGDCTVPTDIKNNEEYTFWSPSMEIPSHTPTSSHDARSTPTTPNNMKSGISPPEAAVEATPETTPVKDLRKLSARQTPVGTAVRALTVLGNGSLAGSSSRPATPTVLLSPSFSTSVSSGPNSNDLSSNTLGCVANRINKIVADRQNVTKQSQRSLTFDEKSTNSEANLNGSNEVPSEDHEILEIVNRENENEYIDQQNNDELYNDINTRDILTDLFEKIERATFRQSVKHKETYDHVTNEENKLLDKVAEDSGTQTDDLFPYEHVLLGILNQKLRIMSESFVQRIAEVRLSPTKMLDQYIDACSRTNSFSVDSKRSNYAKQKQKRKSTEDETEDEVYDDNLETDSANNLLQLMQIQLQFERQRREVHAERNRRLLGKLKESRALEEQKNALNERLKIIDREMEALKRELEQSQRQARQIQDQQNEALHHWQTKCLDEQHQNRLLRDRLESIELELKEEQKKVIESKRQTRVAESAFFDAANQLKGALKAANRGKELEQLLNHVQKKFILLGEIQSKVRENICISSATEEENAQMQKAYLEELNGLRRQLESRTSLVEALKAGIAELESKEARKEAQLVESQRLFQETNERRELELRAVESKYKAQVEINLLLEGRILELHGMLEDAKRGTNMNAINFASSASPKERSPPLSASLASSSEGSLAFIHSGTGIIMNDCCDTTSEIPNLQAIVEPASNQSISPTRLNDQQRVTKQD